MRRKAGRTIFLLYFSPRDLRIMRLRLERIKPGQQIGIAFPSRWLPGSGGFGNRFQSFAFSLYVGACVVIGRIKVCMTEPATNHRHVNACRYQTDR